MHQNHVSTPCIEQMIHDLACVMCQLEILFGTAFENREILKSRKIRNLAKLNGVPE